MRYVANALLGIVVVAAILSTQGWLQVAFFVVFIAHLLMTHGAK